MNKVTRIIRLFLFQSFFLALIIGGKSSRAQLPTGLINNSGICYLNSILQVLFSMPEFNESLYYYLGHKPLEDYPILASYLNSYRRYKICEDNNHKITKADTEGFSDLPHEPIQILQMIFSEIIQQGVDISPIVNFNMVKKVDLIKKLSDFKNTSTSESLYEIFIVVDSFEDHYKISRSGRRKLLEKKKIRTLLNPAGYELVSFLCACSMNSFHSTSSFMRTPINHSISVLKRGSDWTFVSDTLMESWGELNLEAVFQDPNYHLIIEEETFSRMIPAIFVYKRPSI